MRNRLKLTLITFTVLLFSSCYDRSILDHKEYNHALPKVENLSYTKNNDVVNLTWQIPSNISDDFIRPIEVSIQVVENNIYRQVVVIGGEGTSADITIDNTKNYRFIVKLLGYLTEEAQEVGKTDRVYSDGQIIEIQ